MWSHASLLAAAALAFLPGLAFSARGAKLADVATVDDQIVSVHWLDGVPHYKDDGLGPAAFMGHEVHGPDTLELFNPPLDTAATAPDNYTVTSSDDPAYSGGVHPTNAYRRTKVNGTTEKWPEPPFTIEHHIYLKLPQKLQQGKHYMVAFAPAIHSDTPASSFAFDEFNSVSEALHVNLVAYPSNETAVKSADLYMWLGDGGGRDYAAYAGRDAVLYNVKTGEKIPVGKVAFWKKAGPGFGNWNATAADVWTCDFTNFTGAGTFRLCVPGIGCSRDFDLSPTAYYSPFQMSVRGFFYMRIGEPPTFNPPPRQPRFIPGTDPANFQVFLTSFGPWHPEWGRVFRGDNWDHTDWSQFKLPGSPTNPNAWGGHSDACDWDRNPTHISIIYDMLLPYILSNGKLDDDNLNIAESGNGIPDIIDEARYEVDFWLRLRDQNGGYCAGLNNPPGNHTTMYQAAAKPYMAWANAANAAMLADAFRIAGKADLVNHYKAAALDAWKTADEKDLDLTYGIGNGVVRGRDLKMLAAACLYDITGDRQYEDVLAQESVVKDGVQELDNKDKYCQYWPTAAYLMCAKYNWQPIHHPELLAHMKEAITQEAMDKNVSGTQNWPARRSSDTAYGWYQSTIQDDAALIAHAAGADPATQQTLLKALLLEADYSLGRNPMNMVQMSGPGDRWVHDMYTSGRDDGVPGVSPGHTPYMNADAWGKGYMADPQWYAEKGYPAWKNWPHGEALWPVRYCYCNNEFTPQQTMRGKTALYGYLYALEKAAAK